MKRFLGLLLIVTLFLGISGIANATMIGFDEIPGGVAVTDQYAPLGITFQQTIALDSWNTVYAPIKHPGDHVAYSGLDNHSIFLFDDYIDSFSLLVTSGNNDIYLEAYDNSDNLLTSASQFVPVGDWHSMEMGVTGLPVQKIIIHNGSGYFGYDEIRFSSVPEPSTFLFFCLGSIGFVGIKRKVQKSA